MNYGIIIHIIGSVLNFEAAFMLPALITALLYKEKAGYSLLITILLCLLCGILLTRKKVKSK